MPALGQCIRKVTSGTVYYGGLRAPKKVTLGDGTKDLSGFIKEGLNEQAQLAQFGEVNHKGCKYSPARITRAEVKAFRAQAKSGAMQNEPSGLGEIGQVYDPCIPARIPAIQPVLPSFREPGILPRPELPAGETPSIKPLLNECDERGSSSLSKLIRRLSESGDLKPEIIFPEERLNFIPPKLPSNINNIKK